MSHRRVRCSCTERARRLGVVDEALDKDLVLIEENLEGFKRAIEVFSESNIHSTDNENSAADLVHL
jgi:hypothetical protein